MSDATFLMLYVVALVAGELVCMAFINPTGLSMILTVIAGGFLLYIRVLVRERDRQKKKLSAARWVLIQVAFSKCCCSDNAIILKNPAEPETVGKSLPKGYCEVCSARSVLVEEFPGAIEREIEEREFQRIQVPEDLFAALERFHRRATRPNET